MTIASASAGTAAARNAGGPSARHQWIWGSTPARAAYLTGQYYDRCLRAVQVHPRAGEPDIAILAHELSTQRATPGTTYAINADDLGRHGHEHLHTALAWAHANQVTLIVHSDAPAPDAQCRTHTTEVHVESAEQPL